MNKGFLTFSEDHPGLTSGCRFPLSNPPSQSWKHFSPIFLFLLASNHASFDGRNFWEKRDRIFPYLAPLCRYSSTRKRFSHRGNVAVLKDEPEDLTHLAPTPGDVCVPLEDTPFLSEMLDEFILSSDNYCPLLSPGGALAPELRSTDFGDPLKDAELGDTPRSKDLGESLADSDPFMYGDSPSSPCSIDPTAVSPQLAKYRQVSRRSIEKGIESFSLDTLFSPLLSLFVSLPFSEPGEKHRLVGQPDRWQRRRRFVGGRDADAGTERQHSRRRARVEGSLHTDVGPRRGVGSAHQQRYGDVEPAPDDGSEERSEMVGEELRDTNKEKT